MIKLRGTSLVAVLLMAMCACSGSPQPPPQPLPTVELQTVLKDHTDGKTATAHTVLKEDVSDAPIKTQVTQHLLVQADITDGELRTLLSTRYEEVSRRNGFRYHPHPTVIGIYAYKSREHFDSGMGQWEAMLLKLPADVAPKTTIAKYGLAGVPPEVVRFGLSEAQRRDIFKRLVQAEDRGFAEANRRHPAEDVAQAKLGNELVEANKLALGKALELSPEQLEEISLEAFNKNWPAPRLATR